MAADCLTSDLPALRVYPVLDALARPEPRPLSVVASSSRPVRGVGWVLMWAATIAVLFAAAVILIGFFYSLAAEQNLAEAARAGIEEAALPRAPSHSVEQSVWHCLGRQLSEHAQTRIWLLRNGTPVRGTVAPRIGDRLSVTLTLPTWAALPPWLRAICPCQSLPQIEVRAERVVGRV